MLQRPQWLQVAFRRGGHRRWVCHVLVAHVFQPEQDEGTVGGLELLDRGVEGLKLLPLVHALLPVGLGYERRSLLQGGRLPVAFAAHVGEGGVDGYTVEKGIGLGLAAKARQRAPQLIPSYP